MNYGHEDCVGHDASDNCVLKDAATSDLVKDDLISFWLRKFFNETLGKADSLDLDPLPLFLGDKVVSHFI
jgi:hypothetical protein